MRQNSSPIGLIFGLLLVAVVASVNSICSSSRARAEEGFPPGTYVLVTSAGVVSSSGTTPVPILAVPGGNTAPPSHRFWLGGATVFNTDTSSHTVALVSHHSGRVMWECPIPAASGAILDNVNMLASDVGTTALPEGVDMILENGGGAKVGVTAQGYYK